jgi:hypothetical protein
MSFCGGFDPDIDFERGLELMLTGMAAADDSAREDADDRREI